MDIRFLLEGFHVPGITVRTAIEKNWSIIRMEAIMNDTAYAPSYLDSMKLSGRYLFKLIARNCPDCFDTIRRYMKSDYRKYMDMGNPLYLCKTPKQILSNAVVKIYNIYHLEKLSAHRAKRIY